MEDVMSGLCRGQYQREVAQFTAEHEVIEHIERRHAHENDVKQTDAVQVPKPQGFYPR